MRMVYTKLVNELPDGAIVLDFAALDAQYDYPRDWANASTYPSSSQPYAHTTAAAAMASAAASRRDLPSLEVSGCATLDTSWDRGAGTHVAILRRASAADREGGGGDGSMMASSAEERLSAFYEWHCKRFKPFGVMRDGMGDDESGYIKAVMAERAEQLTSIGGAAARNANDPASLPTIRFAHIASAAGGSSNSVLASGVPVLMQQLRELKAEVKRELKAELTSELNVKSSVCGVS